MSQVEEVGIIIRADGTVELANGMKLSSDQVKNLARNLDEMSGRLDTADKNAKKAAPTMREMGEQLGQAGQAAVQLGKDLASGNLQGAAGSLGTLTNAAGGLNLSLGAMVGIGAAAAAGVALVGYAASKGKDEVRGLADALILSGNYAGTTSAQMLDMAARMDKVISTESKAIDVLQQLTASGQIAGNEFEKLGVAAIAWERATGTAISNTVKEYVRLGEDPAKASAKLNEQMNYLSISTYKRIRDLEEQGQKEAAAAVAQEAYAQALSTRARQVEQNAGIMTKAWRAVRDGAMEAWDAMLGIGRTSSTNERIATLERQISGIQTGTEGRSASGQTRLAGLQAQLAALKEVELLQRRAATAEGDRAREVKAYQAADQEWSKIVQANLTKQEQLEKKIDNIRTTGRAMKLPEKDIEEQVRRAREAAAEKGSAPKAYTDDAATRYLQGLRDSNAATLAQLASTDRLTEAQRKQAEFIQLIADLKEKKVLTADQKSLLAAEGLIEAQLKENVLAERLVAIKDAQAKKEKEREEVAKRAEQALIGLRANREELQRNLTQQYDRRLAVFGLGSEAREQLESTFNLQDRYVKLQQDLTERASKGGWMGSAAYQAEAREIELALKKSLADHDAYYAGLKERQGNWALGALQAFNNYQTSAADVAGQTEAAFTNAFKGMEDALVKFAQTGKLDFKSLANSIIADIIRIQTRAAMSGVLKSIMGAASGWLGDEAGMSINNTYGPKTQAGMDNLVNNILADPTKNAKGGVYTSPSLSAFSSQVYSSPQFFAFAKGAGVFAEAGPEAIMPLKRGPDGSLGVGVHGAGAGAVTLPVQVNVTNNGQPVSATVQQRRTDQGLQIDMVLDQLEGRMAERVATGQGSMSRAMESRYGLSTAVG
ncbi:lambda family phage tail tape measure protein [Pseudacidovorax intermedius]|uniref:Lambda family phage tail tape measure protein n=1 Tax=Pseudacidovorax intermedius TaxID=433924 RepID=A0A370FGK0_9BURK|nr:phage tail tape measure protein [Pseudacidovorax intermedius]RDI25175.1 lambda family phage tail tape measure protein [Pseudacidovorax intermedius]